MALIGTIRKNSWLLIIMLGLGLGGFIIMDVSSVGGMGGQTSFTVGEVNGEDIDWVDFQRAEDVRYRGSTQDVYTRRDGLWTYFVEDAIVREEAEANGLVVGDREMQDLQFGQNMSPVIVRNFTDPATQQLDRQSLTAFRDALNQGQLAPEYQAVWNWLTTEVEKERLQTKLSTLVKKGIYTPAWLAERHRSDSRATVDFRYVMIPYDQVDDSEIEVTEEDYKNYMRDNSALYIREDQTRNAKYVVFDVLPTTQDSADLWEEMVIKTAEFEAAVEDSIYAVNNYGSYAMDYVKKETLPEVIADTVFAMSAGQIYGPYTEDGAYKSVKLVDRRIIPDSVHSRHILISIQSQEQAGPGVAKADSIIQLLDSGAVPFDTLAMTMSDDPGSASQGGDLGYVGLRAFLKPLNDLLFFRETEPGKYYRVNTQLGIHIVEVLDKKFETNAEGVRLGYIIEAIIPSDETQDLLYDDVLEFAGLNRTLEALETSAADRSDVSLRTARDILKNDYRIPGEAGEGLPVGATSRDIVRWLFDSGTKVGDVAPEIFTYEDEVNYFNSMYVVAALSGINQKGLARVDDVRDQIEAPVKNKKRAEVIKSRMTATTLPALAAEFDVEIDSVESVNFLTQFMRTIGAEPQVLATAIAMEVGETSGPIVGENGVFVIEVVDKSPAGTTEAMAELRSRAASQIKNAADFELMPALRYNADIEDSRSTYY